MTTPRCLSTSTGVTSRRLRRHKGPNVAAARRTVDRPSRRIGPRDGLVLGFVREIADQRGRASLKISLPVVVANLRSDGAVGIVSWLGSSVGVATPPPKRPPSPLNNVKAAKRSSRDRNNRNGSICVTVHPLI